MIENKGISELADTLANAPRKSKESVLQVVELAYKSGIIDGEIAMSTRLLARTEQAPA